MLIFLNFLFFYRGGYDFIKETDEGVILREYEESHLKVDMEEAFAPVSYLMCTSILVAQLSLIYWKLFVVAIFERRS